MAGELTAALALVLANAFFVATEFAITRLRPTQVDDLVAEGRPGAASARHAVEHIDAYLSACQLGITVASLGLGVVGEPVFAALLEPLLGEGAEVAGFGLAAAAGFSIATLLHVVVGELAPKSLAIARTVPAVLALAPPMRAFYVVTRPIVDLFNAMGNLLLKPFGIPPAREVGHSPVSEDELRSLLRQSAEEGLIDVDEGRLGERVLLYGDLRARQVMVPRPEVAIADADGTLREVAALAIETGRTRLPLCGHDGDLDAAVGMLHVKDLLAPLLGDGDAKPRELARPLPQVPGAMPIDQLLADLRSRHTEMALVVDEHGTATGVVTVEDVLEEIVGEIEDEFDDERAERQAGEAREPGAP